MCMQHTRTEISVLQRFFMCEDPYIWGMLTLHSWQRLLYRCLAAILGSLGCRAVRVEDQGVESSRDGAVLSQAEHILALVKVLVIQHQQSLRMHPARNRKPLTSTCFSYPIYPATSVCIWLRFNSYSYVGRC